MKILISIFCRNCDHSAGSLPVFINTNIRSEFINNYLQHARSSRTSFVVAHQEIGGLQRISPDFAGTRTVWRATRQTERMWLFNVDTGEGSQREAEEFVIHPNLVKTLGVGKCVCVKKYPESRAYLVDVSLGS